MLTLLQTDPYNRADAASGAVAAGLGSERCSSAYFAIFSMDIACTKSSRKQDDKMPGCLYSYL